MLMFYRHRLPSDAAMDGIRARIAARGPLWDAVPGLGFKAFTLEERAAGSPENAYASLYFWLDPRAAMSFLADERFRAVVEAFGRPEIDTWMPLDVRAGAAGRTGFLDRSEASVPLGTDLGDLIRSEAERNRDLAETSGVLAAVSGLDPRTWRITRFTLRAGAPASGAPSSILHLARPGLPPAIRS
jgi:hypothetical protein